MSLAADDLLSQVDCITNLTDNTVVASLPTILEKANEKNIPVFGSEIEQVRIGCLAAEGIDYIALGEQTGKMAAQILKGEKEASEMECVKSCTEPGFYVNTKVAENLGITVPEELASSAVESFDEITAESILGGIFMSFFITILEQGLIYGILALGVYITYKILDFPDLTVDGSFPLGGCCDGCSDHPGSESVSYSSGRLSDRRAGWSVHGSDPCKREGKGPAIRNHYDDGAVVY